MSDNGDIEMDNLGPEPNLVPLPNSSQTKSTPFITLKTADDYPVKADWFKCGVSTLLWVIFIVCFVIAFAAIQSGHFFRTPSTNTANAVRTANLIQWGNQSANPCTNIYDYACGTYSKSYSEASVFEQTQRVLYSELDNTGMISLIQNITSDASVLPHFTLEELDLAGIMSCISVEVAPDYTDRSTPAVYISATCSDCIPSRTSGSPERVTQFPPGIPFQAFYTMVNVAEENLRNVYFLPPNGTSILFSDFVQKECSFGDAQNASNIWLETVANVSAPEIFRDTLNQHMLSRVQNQTNPDYISLEARTAVDKIIMRVKSEMTFQVENAAWAEGQREALAERISQLQVLVGGGPSVIPSCTLDEATTLYSCLRFRWQAQLQILAETQPLNESKIWDITSTTVNAIYSPLSDTIQISAALLQPPLFDHRWDQYFQYASAGFIIAHEMSHALSPVITRGWTNAVTQTNSTISFERCIEGALQASGSERQIRTSQESWADTIATKAMIRAFRQGGLKIVKTASTALIQNFCEAGHKKVRSYVIGEADAHPTGFLRTTTAFYVASGSQLEAAWACGQINPAYNCF